MWRVFLIVQQKFTAVVYGLILCFSTCGLPTFLCCSAGNRIQIMTAVPGSLFFEAISHQIFSLIWLSPQLLWLAMTHMHSRQSARTTRSLRHPDLGGSLWNITTQEEKECLLCCTRGQVVLVRVKFSMSRESLMCYVQCLFFKAEIHAIGSRSASGLTFSVWMWWSGAVCWRS